jgi:hypothetical protein
MPEQVIRVDIRTVRYSYRRTAGLMKVRKKSEEAIRQKHKSKKFQKVDVSCTKGKWNEKDRRW